MIRGSEFRSRIPESSGTDEIYAFGQEDKAADGAAWRSGEANIREGLLLIRPALVQWTVMGVQGPG